MNLLEVPLAELPPTSQPPSRPTVLVADDTPANLMLLAGVLSPHWRVQLAPTGSKALELAWRQTPDVIVLDVMMPGMDGYEVCRQLKAHPATRDVPVLFLTALTQPADEARGFECGGADFIHKPFNPSTVLARVGTQIEARAWRQQLHRRNEWLQQELQARLVDVDRLREATLHVMISFAEFRDESTGHHVRRTQEYVRVLLEWLSERATPGLDPDLPLNTVQIDLIARSAPLHDIGKVAIPDGILLKPGRLNDEEMRVMKTHALQGWEMLRRASDRMGPAGDRYLHYGMQIARHHHERWDGQGYPDGLRGKAIPLSARVMAVADVYDALISRRPYKEPMSHEAALALVQQGSGGHFDPAVVQALLARQDAVRHIAERWCDEPVQPQEDTQA
jgi:putative two-component system response regulator